MLINVELPQGKRGRSLPACGEWPLPTNGSYRLTYSTSLSHILRDTETRNVQYATGTWQRVSQQARVPSWSMASMSRVVATLPSASMLMFLSLGPTNVTAEEAIEKKGDSCGLGGVFKRRHKYH
jgi:hypothetical protein